MMVPEAKKVTKAEQDYCTNLHRIILLEPVYFLYMLGDKLMELTISALIYRKSCAIDFNETVCENLKNYTAAEDQVQAYASYWTMAHSLCNFMPGVFLTSVYGAWSDRYGDRKSVV